MSEIKELLKGLGISDKKWLESGIVFEAKCVHKKEKMWKRNKRSALEKQLGIIYAYFMAFLWNQSSPFLLIQSCTYTLLFFFIWFETNKAAVTLLYFWDVMSLHSLIINWSLWCE